MKFGAPQQALQRKGIWLQHKADLWANNRQLHNFIARWVREMEAQMAMHSNRHVRDFANSALISTGGLNLSRADIQRAVRILGECWQYGESLVRWATYDSTWMR